MTTSVADRQRATSVRVGVRIAGWSAILWGVLSVARAPLTGEVDMPPWTAPRPDIVAFADRQDFDAAFVVGIAMAAVGWCLLMVFLAVVSSLLPERLRWVGYLILGGGAISIAGTITYLSLVGAGVFWASNGGLGADGHLVLNGLTWSFLWIDQISGFLWVLPLAIVIVHTALFPRWLGWLMVANVAAAFVAFFLPPEVSMVTGGLPYLWILVAGVVMLARFDRYAAPAVLREAQA
ncbi:MAG: hypothetical protein R3246_10550 [Acidimicrobiia bacterium]|nr:hypothetical protein [Acidimicrobiia bacterium]